MADASAAGPSFPAEAGAYASGPSSLPSVVAFAITRSYAAQARIHMPGMPAAQDWLGEPEAEAV